MNKHVQLYSSAIEGRRKKERGVRGYYKLRKAELIHDLEAAKCHDER